MEKGNQASLTDIVQTEILPAGYLLPITPTVLLKTPVSSEKGNLDRPWRYLNRNESGGRFDLSDQVASLLPTPRAQNGESRNQNIYARPLDQPQNLENALALLPTPLTRPSKNGQIWVRPDDEFQNLENAIAHIPSVNALLPTPLASDYKQAGFQPSLSAPERSESISVAIMNLLPTPTVMDLSLIHI